MSMYRNQHGSVHRVFRTLLATALAGAGLLACGGGDEVGEDSLGPASGPLANPRPPTPPAQPAACSNTCEYAFDDECDDGSPGAVTDFCAPATDCTDCGSAGPSGPVSSPPVSVNPPSAGTTPPLAGTWSGSVSSLGTSVTRTTTFTADGSPIFVCGDGTQTPLTSVAQTFQCVDEWLSGGSRLLTLGVLRLLRQQTRVEFDLKIQIPGGIRIGTTINGPTTITELGRDVLYRYTFALSGNQLSYTLDGRRGSSAESDAVVIESGVLTKR